MATKLVHLKIDRVDGVDDPATGKPFLLMKAGDADDVLGSLASIQKKVSEVIEAMRSEGVSLSKGLAEHVVQLAKMCELKCVTKEVEEAAAAAVAPPPAAAAAAAVPGDALAASLAKMADGLSSLSKSIESMPDRIVEGIAKSFEDGGEGGEPPPAEPPPESQQPAPEPVQKGRGTGREFGKGLFHDVIFPKQSLTVARR